MGDINSYHGHKRITKLAGFRQTDRHFLLLTVTIHTRKRKDENNL